jgi:hypothetical protein
MLGLLKTQHCRAGRLGVDNNGASIELFAGLG